MFATNQSLVHTPPNPPGGGGGGALGEMESPRNPFSISVILSDEVGQKRSPPSNASTPSFSFASATPLSRNNRQRHHSQEDSGGKSADHAHFFHTPIRPPHQGSGGSWGARSARLSLSEAGDLATSPPTSRGLATGASSSRGATWMQGQRLTPSRSNNSSITASPFNASLLQALGQQPVTTPTNKSRDILDDSLGMLSTVALLDSEISNVNTTAGTSVQEKLAGMMINSHREGSVSSHDEEMSGAHCLESSNMAAASPTARKGHTPHILRRDRRRQRKQSLTDSSKLSVSSASGGDSTHLNTGFLSPLAQGNSDHASKQHFTFSPSIFLSRPNDADEPSPKHARPTSLLGGDLRQGGIGHAPGNYPIGPLSPSSESDGGMGEEFVTSTPIKSNKENLHKSGGRSSEGGEATGGGGGGGGWSPSILQTSGGRRQLLREANDASSGSDSELPVKKLKTTPLAHPHQNKRRKSKARTKLSPLLENACSPIAKADHTHQPSPLVTSVTSTPSRAVSPPHTQAPSTSNAVIGQLRPPISAESAQPPPVQPTSSYMQGASPHHAHLPTNILHGSHQARLQQQQQTQQLMSGQQVPGAFSIMHTSTPAPQTLLSTQTPLINPSLSYPFNPMVPAFGGFLPLQSYAPPVCVPGFLPGMSFFNPQAQLHTAPSMYPPPGLAGHVNYVGNSSSLVAPKSSQWSGSMCSPPQTSLSQNSQLQSVPPWFIFSDKRADSKRSRLSEAINKSLSETPSQKTKLPVEWSKYACGQTDDQRSLTEEARSFLLMKPRQLHFDEES